ncbi:MAG: hypothetical protein ABIJ10_03470 [Candidatus Micrarchaeota archaeon]
MAENSREYKIKKIEKGPLQRFKNQNLLLKKFGEIGLQIYKSITGKRTVSELRKDLGFDPGVFDQVLAYMQDAGMVELESITRITRSNKDDVSDSSTISSEEEPEKDIANDEGEPSLADLPEDDDIAPEEESPLEEAAHSVSVKGGEDEEKSSEDEDIIFDDIEPIDVTETDSSDKTETDSSDKQTDSSHDSDDGAEPERDDIEPITDDESNQDGLDTAKNDPEESTDDQKDSGEGEIEIESENQGPGDQSDSDLELSSISDDLQDQTDSKLSPVEKIIFDRYGDLGLRVYSLIDGQRTAEEIMADTGLSETKLVEILDFMDEQGIIKLDYPKGSKGGSGSKPPPTSPGGQAFAQPPPQQSSYRSQSVQPQPSARKSAFVPMVEDDEKLDQVQTVPSPIESPVKAPLDIIRSVQAKAKLMLKYGDKGGKVFELINGKNDIIDITLKLDIPLYDIIETLAYMMENGMIIMKPLSRTDVRKKYGDDGYSVYKRYGKEGLMLYELIGKELTIRQMADKITKDKSNVIDMFIFIHRVLGIELPIDKDVLAKQLGL